MFVETNGIGAFVVDLDGFFVKKGQKIVPRRNFNEVIDVIKDFPLAFVSRQLTEEEATEFLNQEIGKTFKVFVPRTGFLEAIMFRGPILRAKQSLKKHNCDTVYISASPESISEAISARLGTILVGADDFSDHEKDETFKNCPDFKLDEIAELKMAITGELLGYKAEVETTHSEYFKKLYPAKPSRAYITGLSFDKPPAVGYPSMTVRLLGRYFDSKDPRYYKHALTRRVLNFKSRPSSQAKAFSSLFGSWISHLDKEDPLDLITAVPAQPGEENRFKAILQELGSTYKNKVKEDLLLCIENYPKQKTTANSQERKDNVKGKFKVNSKYDVKGKRILLLDDIFTTGSTISENAKVLFDAGAKSVTPLCLSFHVFAPITGVKSTEILKCPQCGSKLEGRCNGTTGQFFYGCSKFHETKCKGSMTHVEGVRLLNTKIDIDPTEIEKDIPKDISF